METTTNTNATVGMASSAISGPGAGAGAQVAPARGALEEPARVLGLELVDLAARAGDDDAGGGQERCSSRPNAIAARIDRSADGDRERADHAEARAMRTDRRSRRAEIRKAGDEPADRRAALHPREPHPGAGVDARDEREMAVRRAPDVETVRVRELRRVAVGGSDPERDERSRVHRDAPEHRVAYGAPIAELVRALEAEELLDGGRDQAGLGAEPQVLPRVLEQAHDGVGDQVRRGLVARVEEEDALVQELQLGEAVARVLGREQRGQDLAGIRARAPPPLGDQPAEIALELVNGAAARLEAPGAGLRLERAENRERPAAQRPALLPRHAEHVADELDGKRGGEVLHHVHPAPGGGAVEEPVDEPDDARLERGEDPPPGGPAGEGAAGGGVGWGLA